MGLYRYISYIGEETNQNKITVKLNINQQLNSLTMTVASPEDTTRYRNIRLPYQLAGMIPFVAGKNPAEQGYKALTGESWMSQCVVGEGYDTPAWRSTSAGRWRGKPGWSL